MSKAKSRDELESRGRAVALAPLHSCSKPFRCGGPRPITQCRAVACIGRDPEHSHAPLSRRALLAMHVMGDLVHLVVFSHGDYIYARIREDHWTKQEFQRSQYLYLSCLIAWAIAVTW